MQTRYFHLTDFKRRENGFQVNPHLKRRENGFQLDPRLKYRFDCIQSIRCLPVPSGETLRGNSITTLFLNCILKLLLYSSADIPSSDPSPLQITVLYSITMFLALTGNLLLIFIVASKPETRTLTGFLFVNMAVADLLVTFIAMPVTMAIPYTNLRWLPGILGQITCKVVYFSLHVSIVASILSLMLMAVDRFLGVVYVFPFRRFPSFRRAKLLTGLVWLISMIAMIPASFL